MNQETSQLLWAKAKQYIPGGNSLLSKRPELFLPTRWPTYFSKAKGCTVWDIDGNKYFDFAHMSVGTCSLGYSHDSVDEAVRSVIALGTMSTLNCPEEVQLAEQLVYMHPWADMVRFARSGGEANAIAVRIARAASGRDCIAICGYHGWHDWYLSANLNDSDGLNDHLLPGLQANGVPKALADTCFPFRYNDLDHLQRIIDNHDLAAIKMEVLRSTPPAPGFLEKVRELCSLHGIVLIFDECTSGFRQAFGGIHKLYGVSPDIAMFGKALGNGFPITAVIGKADVMQSAQSTFISSTFWTDRIGPVAALQTLKCMEDIESWTQLTSLGRYLQYCWSQLAVAHDLDIKFNGIPALIGFSFDSPDFFKYKTLITQEMLKKGYLASTSCYLSISHTRSLIDEYIYNLDPIFSLIAQCSHDEVDIDSLLDVPVCHTGFSRLN